MEFSKTDTQKIKGLAIILMFIHHCFLSPSRYVGQSVSFYPFTESVVNNVALAMKICVALFVFLSAYGITISFKRKNSRYEISGKEINNLTLKRYVKLMAGFMFVFALLQIYSVATGKGWYTHVYGKGTLSVFYCVVDLFGLAQLFHTPTFISTFWYMSLAQIIVIVMPILIYVYKRFGTMVLLGAAIVFSTLFPVTTENAAAPQTYAFFPIYVVCIALGLIAADKDLFVRMKSYNPIKAFPIIGNIVKGIVYFLIIILLVYFRQKNRNTMVMPIFESVIPFFVIAFGFEYLNRIPLLNNILSVLGKYSMNMFLIHNFIRIAWYYDFTYSFHNAWLIVLVLLTISLLISAAIEMLKKLIRFDKLVNNLIINKADKI